MESEMVDTSLKPAIIGNSSKSEEVVVLDMKDQKSKEVAMNGGSLHSKKKSLSKLGYEEQREEIEMQEMHDKY